MKIIALPFAGGNKHSFNFLKPYLTEKNVIEYPGRGELIEEDLLDSMNKLVKHVTPLIISEINDSDEYIIYGHSMGALVGYLICVEIEKLGFKTPVKLVVSGAKPPKYSKEKILSNLEDKDFWKEVNKLGGIPEELNLYPELIEYFTPILKADFRCVENYKHDNNLIKLTIPIDVFYGSDEVITQTEAEAWQEQTTAKINVKELKGNHFFIYNHQEFFIKYFKNLILKTYA